MSCHGVIVTFHMFCDLTQKKFLTLNRLSLVLTLHCPYSKTYIEKAGISER